MLRAIIFDFDGTLADTISALCEGINLTMKAYGYPEHTEDEVRTFINNGARELIRRAMPRDLQKDEALVDRVLADYDKLATEKDWYNPMDCCLVLNGAEYAKLKAVMHAAHLSASPAALAEELGFKKVIVLSGMTARAAIVPYGSLGFMARVPALVADYKESGVETDPDSGLSIGIVVATDQGINREVVNGDLWFGCAAVSASADADKTHGIIKVGTAS